ncbi:TonB-dependent receptor [Phenylobacterium sp.]|uniref:TonB-dependent receptor n=1 Tax=Phenylobacterium sp. TaxID=1871053 RepID=UPI00301B7DF9
MGIRSLIATTAFAALAVPAAAGAQARTYDIASQPLDQALLQLARAADRGVAFTPETVAGRRSSAVRGATTFEGALTQMLQGADATFRIGPDGAATIIRRPEPPAARPAPGAARPAAAAVPPRDEVAEVVVTVQKRAERAQDVPIPMTVIDGRAAEALRLDSLRDVSRLAPGLLVSTFSANSPVIAIRGATNTFQQIGVNKPVSVVLDDVFLPRNTVADTELFDLASVQVLKGPQGTLFGRNVTGGVIVIDTGVPSFSRRSAVAQVGYGNHDAWQFRASASTPLGDMAAARVSFSIRDRDGYGRDRLTGQTLDDLQSRNIRGQVRIAPAEGLDLLASADYAEDSTGGRTLSSKTLGSDGDRRTAELGVRQRFDRTLWGVSLRGTWDMPAGQFTSITAYRESQSGEFYSGVGANFAFLTGGAQQVNDDADALRTFTQEVRYASPKWRFGDLVAGVYYLDEDATRRLTQTGLAARTGVVASEVFLFQTVKATSLGVFVDGGVNLPGALRLTVGGRYTHDEKTASLDRRDRLNPAAGFSLAGLEESWSEFTPRAVLSWTPAPDVMAYASVAKGFTSGGFNTDAATPAALATPFAPETVVNYEAGLKSQWFDRRLRLNVSAFHMTYDDKQELLFNGITRVLTIVNASEATSKGFEIEATATPMTGVNLGVNYGFLDTRYDDFVIPGGANNTGNRLGSSPRVKYSLLLDVRRPVTGAGYALVNATYTRTGGYFTGAARDPSLFVAAYDLVNASAGFETTDGRFRVMVWGKNLGDTDYVLIPSTQGVLAEYLGEPRTYGVSLTARF